MRSLSSSSVAARFWCGWGGHAIWRALGPEDAVPRMAACGGVGQGFLANALNPPVALFYFLVVPRFVPAGAPLFRSVMILTMVHVGLAFTWHASCAAAAERFRDFSRREPRAAGSIWSQAWS